MTMNIPYLSSSDLDGLCLKTADVIGAIEQAILGSTQGRVWAAPKAVVMPPDDQRYMMAALAAMDAPSLLAVKTVVLNPENPAQGLPQINGLVTMLDSVTGLPAAILDGNWITAVRTAGLSATAAKHMARPDASVIGFAGCGVQARSHLQAFAEIFDLEQVKIFGRGQANKDALRAMAEGMGLSVEGCAEGQEIVETCDLIVTSITHTSVDEPFLDAGGMRAGAFAAVVDLAGPWRRESFSALGRVVIDDLVQEAALPNKLCDPADVTGDLTGLVTGQIAGRADSKEASAFVFRGHALGDLALSALALETYRARAT
jgi:ornithine cyclodeaminase/alanine dehydrogenase-like protein (mu-crystallin family)